MACLETFVKSGIFAQICEIRPLARNPFFEVVNVATYFSALATKG
jgi:hypothetical protein